MSTVICARPGQEAGTVQTGLVSVWKQSVSLSNKYEKRRPGTTAGRCDGCSGAARQAGAPVMPTGEKIRAHGNEHRARNVRIVWAACRLRLRFVPTYANSREMVKNCHGLVKDR